MELIADMLMVLGTFAVAIYCIVLARRLSRFTDLEKGVGGAVAVLSVQVDDMTKTLIKAQKTAINSAGKLEDLTMRAEDASRKLEILIASMHDLPEPSDLSEEIGETSTLKENDTASELAEDENSGQADNNPLFLSNRNRVEAAG